MRLYIVRHAETERNRSKKSCSDSDVLDKNSALNDDGRFQAMKLGEYFKSECLMDAIYCSPALRSFKTAELIFQFMKNSDTNMYFDDRLYNLDVIKDKSKLKSDLMSLILSIHKKYGQGDVPKNILLVTHNHIIDVMHKLFVEQVNDLDTTPKYKVDNCSVSCVEVVKIDSDIKFSVKFWDMTLRTTYLLID